MVSQDSGPEWIDSSEAVVSRYQVCMIDGGMLFILRELQAEQRLIRTGPPI
ncbi:hypothetical protein [Nocardiopsis sp. CC223A]|uniref:hypothetical protein n=1 Tax=Nocardiopsis sp. CC223A TaxID=3044051 RepID=UPI00278C390D|nr:hypothetical protein [Nocardiopsis sp. CC223A]